MSVMAILSQQLPFRAFLPRMALKGCQSVTRTKIINAAKDVPSVQAYTNHFDGLNGAYTLIGYPLVRDTSDPLKCVLAY